MEGIARELKWGISRQFSTGSLRSLSRQFSRQASLDPLRNNLRFSFGRQSSLDPTRRAPPDAHSLAVPENLDFTMQLLFVACQGDASAVDDLLNQGADVNSIDLDRPPHRLLRGPRRRRQAPPLPPRQHRRPRPLGQHRPLTPPPLPVDLIVLFLLSNLFCLFVRSFVCPLVEQACADAKFYGNVEAYNILKARGAKAPKTTRKTPMAVANPRQVPEYELNPLELQIRKSDGITKGSYQVAKWNGTKVVVKILDKDSYSDPETINAFKHELTLLEKVRHPNVVQFVGAVTQNVPMMIVSEYAPHGDLASYIHKKGRLSPSRALKFALDISRGMNYLHECKPDPIIHCDLMPKCQKYFAG